MKNGGSDSHLVSVFTCQLCKLTLNGETLHVIQIQLFYLLEKLQIRSELLFSLERLFKSTALLSHAQKVAQWYNSIQESPVLYW